jgi:type IX secretion system PorP/SprF family membrane protein
MCKNLSILTFSCLLLLGCATDKAMAQDIHFSQYFASPLSLNPALTGAFTGDWRIIDNYRNQWSSVTKAFSTNGISYDRHIYLKKGNQIGAGLLWVNDQSGIASLIVNKILISTAFHTTVKGNHISIGLQGGYVIKNVNTAALTFPDQYNNQTGAIDPTLPNNEALLNDKLSYIDMNAGLNWSRVFGKFSPEAGISFFHLNKPNESFVGKDNSLPIRSIFNMNLHYKINKLLTYTPSMLYMRYNAAVELVLGNKILFNMWENSLKLKNIYAGIYLRSGVSTLADATIVLAGLQVKSLGIGASYDVNVSKLNTASNYKGAYEFSLIYTGLNSIPQKLKIPCERY